MGFWHTGYFEFHEPTGIDPPVALKPRRFFCDRCNRSFASRDELEDHRFAECAGWALGVETLREAIVAILVEMR